MSGKPAGLATMLAFTLLAASGVSAATKSAPPKSFAERLAKAGRAEARLERSAADPLSGKASVVHGTIALEPPDRAAIAVKETGEKIAVRKGGGEWLQPSLHQMIELGPAQAAAVGRLWTLLASGAGRIALGESTGVAADSARVRYDAAGLPSVVEVEEPNGKTTYRLSGWRFAAAKGAKAFKLLAPAGYTTVPLQ